MGIFSSKPEVCKLLILGLDNSGQSTVVRKLTNQSTGNPYRSVEKCSHNGANFEIWDIDRHDRIRPLFRHYFGGVRALIYVVDSTDQDRIEKVRENMQSFLNEGELGEIPLLVLANKQVSIIPNFGGHEKLRYVAGFRKCSECRSSCCSLAAERRAWSTLPCISVLCAIRRWP